MIRCLGCGKKVDPLDPMNVKRCTCGSIVYHDGAMVYYAESSLFGLLRLLGLPIPMSRHIEDLFGVSRHTSKLKREYIQKMMAMGMVWAKDCPDCKGRLARQTPTQLKKADGQAAVEEWERMLKGGGHAP